jgi:transaldolase
MRIFIESTSLDEMSPLADAGLMDGVILPSSGIAARDVEEHVSAISQAFAIPICVPISVLAEADIYRYGRELARLSDQVVVQIPFVEDAIMPIRKLVADGIKVCASYICSGAQAFLAAKIGASMLSVQVEYLDAQGQRSAELVSDIRDVIALADMECHLAVESPSNSRHFTECLLAGADIVCLTPMTLRILMTHSLTDRRIDRFLRDLTRRQKPWNIS